MRVLGLPVATQQRKTFQVLKWVGLQHRMNAFPEELSGGEQQRIAIARALVNDPQLVLADEPTGNLDPDLSLEIMNLFREINARGTTVVVATHDRELIRRVGRRVGHARSRPHRRGRLRCARCDMRSRKRSPACGAGRQAGLLSTLTIALALFVLGGFLDVTANLERLGAEWSNAAELSVYLKDDITPAERRAVEGGRGAERSGRGARIHLEARRARALQADVRRSRRGGRRRRREPAAGVARGPSATGARRQRRRRRPRVAAAPDGRRRRRALRPAMADSRAVGDQRDSRHRPGAGLGAGRGGGADGRQCRPAGAVRATGRAGHHEPGRRAAGLCSRPVRHGRGPAGRDRRPGRAGRARRRVSRAAWPLPHAACLGDERFLDPFLPAWLCVALVVGGMAVGCLGGLVAAWNR